VLFSELSNIQVIKNFHTINNGGMATILMLQTGNENGGKEWKKLCFFDALYHKVVVILWRGGRHYATAAFNHWIYISKNRIENHALEMVEVFVGCCTAADDGLYSKRVGKDDSGRRYRRCEP
jgi:hypothetical protein